MDHNDVWDLVNCLKIANELGVNGFIRSSVIQMAISNYTRPNSLLKVLLKQMALTAKRLFISFQENTSLDLLWHWWLIMI